MIEYTEKGRWGGKLTRKALPIDDPSIAGLSPKTRADLANVWLRRAAMERRQPVLGICLGAQLIARSTGARVYKNRVKEIGWFDIHLTDYAAKDSLFEAMNRTESVFHWHGETFDLPAGAELLASSERCAHQAFRLGDRTYGLQFHPEVTPSMIADWVCQDANCGDVAELAEPVDPNRGAERLAWVADRFFGRWAHSLAAYR